MPQTAIEPAAPGPWLKNRQWARGRCRDRTGSFMFFSILFALVLDTIAVLAITSTWRTRAKSGLAPLVFVTIILLPAGAAMSAWALRELRVRMKFGRSVFELETLPGVVGHFLAGTIRVPVPLNTTQGIRLDLECVARVEVRPINGRPHTSEKSLLKRTQHLGPDLPRDAAGTAIPVSFQIPPDAPPTGRHGPTPIFWRLHARAPQPGADYDATFLVPVFTLPTPPTTTPKAESAADPLRRSQKSLASHAG